MGTTRARWHAEDPRLLRRETLAHARRVVEAYEARDPHQRLERERILSFIDAHPDALRRSCLTGHLTTSALVVHDDGRRALLTHHRKLDRWLQLGGHCDGEGNLVASAWREATEESGIPDLAIDPVPIDLDIHRIPEPPSEPSHLHLDVRFLAYAPAGATEQLSDESHALAWFSPDDLDTIDTDDSVRRLFRLAF